jgi:transposase-like protein
MFNHRGEETLDESQAWTCSKHPETYMVKAGKWDGFQCFSCPKCKEEFQEERTHKQQQVLHG